MTAGVAGERQRRPPVVCDHDGLRRHDGRQVRLEGLYQAIVMPSKRPPGGTPPRGYAQIVLADGTEVLVERYNTAAAERPASELERFDGARVRVTGVAHLVPPSAGQAPDKPGILDLESIEAAEPAC